MLLVGKDKYIGFFRWVLIMLLGILIFNGMFYCFYGDIKILLFCMIILNCMLFVLLEI